MKTRVLLGIEIVEDNPWLISDLGFRYLPYSELRSHRAAIARFGSGLKPLLEISQSL